MTPTGPTTFDTFESIGFKPYAIEGKSFFPMYSASGSPRNALTFHFYHPDFYSVFSFAVSRDDPWGLVVKWDHVSRNFNPNTGEMGMPAGDSHSFCSVEYPFPAKFKFDRGAPVITVSTHFDRAAGPAEISSQLPGRASRAGALQRPLHLNRWPNPISQSSNFIGLLDPGPHPVN